MATTGELIGLVRQIRGAPSSMEKLKMAALAWRTLRALSPTDRMKIARELGLEGAERIVEELSLRGGLSPAALLTAIHRAEEADPEQLESLMAGFKDPERRAQALEHVAEAADEYFSEELAAAAEDKGAEEPPVPESPPPPAAPETIESPAAAPPVEVVPPPRTAPKPPAPPPPRRHPPEPARTQAPAFSVGDQIRAEATSIGRLRRLDAVLQRSRKFTSTDCLQLIESFSPGWSRRRALERILRAGSPSTLDEALALIDTAAGPGDRLWALTALAERTGWGPADSRRIVAAASSPALARRLRVRLGH